MQTKLAVDTTISSDHELLMGPPRRSVSLFSFERKEKKKKYYFKQVVCIFFYIFLSFLPVDT